MDDAALYSKYNYIHMVNVKKILENYLHLINFRNDAKILDVGCGDGAVSMEVLLPKLPKHFKKLLLSDLSDDMITLAQMKFKDTKIDVIQLDIASTTIPNNLFQHFDHVFSFHCLHWVEEEKQSRAMKNIHDMLKPGGSAFLTIIGTSPFFDFYENMSKSVKWASYTSNFRKFIPVYNYVKNPEEKLKFILETAGFEVRLCVVETCYHIFSDWDEFLNFSLSVNPFVKSLPENKRYDYIEDYRKELKQSKSIRNEISDGVERIYQPYEVLIAYASKPL